LIFTVEWLVILPSFNKEVKSQLFYLCVVRLFEGWFMCSFQCTVYRRPTYVWLPWVSNLVVSTSLRLVWNSVLCSNIRVQIWFFRYLYYYYTYFYYTYTN